MPAITSTFRSGEPSLSDLLSRVDGGRIQLPDFQRRWVWDDDHIRSLLASISLSYPIGAVMLLETDGGGAGFLPRPIEGVELAEPVEPEQLILDGQQRMTSLYLALLNEKPVPTKTSRGQRIDRHYYVDIAIALDPEADRLDAIISVPADRRTTSDFGRSVELDLSTPEKEREQAMFPMDAMYSWEKYSEWRREFQSRSLEDRERYSQFDRFEAEVVSRFRDYRVPTIELLRDTPKTAVCQVFEKVNTGGVTLTVFELVTAMFAADNFRLRDDWEVREERLSAYPVLEGFDGTSFLTAVTLLSTYDRHIAADPEQTKRPPVSCKRSDVLKLVLADYRRNADRIERGLISAAKLLVREKVFDAKSVPYATQFIPLSAICAAIEAKLEQDPVKKKLARWLWCGVFGELYGGANESRYAFDLPEVVRWVEGGEEPRTVRDMAFSPTRLLGLQTRNSAAYKGIMAQLIAAGSLDFLSGDAIEVNSYFDMSVDIHHIFPAAYCDGLKIDKQRWNSAVNKAPLSYKTNRTLGGRAPSKYLAALEDRHGLSRDRLREILDSHLVDSSFLWADDFDGFLRDRACKLLDLIEKATGRAVAGRDSDEVVEAFGAALVWPKDDQEQA